MSGSASETPMVKAEAVSKSFGSNEVLKSISLEVNRGEVLCLVGPSGSGKSTFLRCINHLETISGGRLWVDGELVGYRQQGDKIYELRPAEADEIREHLLACEPCLDHYQVEDAWRLLIRRCCAGEKAPDGLRLRVRATYTRTVIVTETAD